jgi:hypothetical protein
MNFIQETIKNILTLNFSVLEQTRNIVVSENIIFVDDKPLIHFTNEVNPRISIDLEYNFGFHLYDINIKNIEFNDSLFSFNLSVKGYFNEVIFELFKQIKVTYDL